MSQSYPNSYYPGRRAEGGGGWDGASGGGVGDLSAAPGSMGYRGTEGAEVGRGQPHAVYCQVADVGKKMASSKKRAVWRFTFGEDGDEHEVVLLHSALSGKKKLIVNGKQIFESQRVASFEWSHGWAMGNHACRCDIRGEGNYDLTIDAVPFRRWPKVDPQLAAQLRVAKADSQKTFKEDETRRKSWDKERKARGDSAGGTPGKDKMSLPRPESDSKSHRQPSSTQKQGDGRQSSKNSSSVSRVRQTTTPPSRDNAPSAENGAILDILSVDLPPPPPPDYSNPGTFDPLASRVSASPQLGAVSDSAAILQLGMQFGSMHVQQYQEQQGEGEWDPGFASDGANVQTSKPQNEHLAAAAPKTSGVKDLWQVATDNDFVNINDLRGTAAPQTVVSKPMQAEDQRSLSELAANSALQRDGKMTVMANMPPPQHHQQQNQFAQQPGFYPSMQPMMGMGMQQMPSQAYYASGSGQQMTTYSVNPSMQMQMQMQQPRQGQPSQQPFQQAQYPPQQQQQFPGAMYNQQQYYYH